VYYVIKKKIKTNTYCYSSCLYYCLSLDAANNLPINAKPFLQIFFSSSKMPRPTKRKTNASISISRGIEKHTKSQRKRRQLEQTNAPDNQVIPNITYIARQQLPLHFTLEHRLKPFSSQCQTCLAKHWLEEKASNSSMRNPEFTTCCAAGKVRLPAPVYPPAELANYLLDETQGKHMRTLSKNIKL
jgi:hypothetical protein